MQKYNTGNIEKYHTKNPLKRKMVDRLNRRIIDELRMMIGNREVSILDAGCGEGFISRMIAAEFPKARVTGLEYTAEALAAAKEMGKGIEYVQGNIMEMPFDDNSFDLICCTEVLEHLDNPDKALMELMRTGREGVLITVPHEPWFCMGNVLALKNLSRFGNPVDHINHWTFRGFQRFVGKRAKRVTYGKSFPWSIANISL